MSNQKDKNYIVPGEVRLADGDIELNAGRDKVKIRVSNTGDRPVQVGSHIHFVETNPELSFDRKEAIGRRLNIPSGTAARFEPGQEMEVELVDIGGTRHVYGIHNLTDGSIDEQKDEILQRAKEKNFKGVE